MRAALMVQYNQFFDSRRILWVFLVLAFLSLPGMGCMGTSQSPNLRVGWISDFHFNPYFDPTIVPQLAGATPDQWDTILAASLAHASMPVTGEDTNRRLLESALSALREDVAEPAFVVFTGDFLTHHFKEQYAALTGDASVAGLQQFTNRTLSYLVLRIRRHFPTSAVYFCLGNNDSYEGDYQQTQNGPFLRNTTEIFATTLLANDRNRALLRRDYPVFGSYRVELPGLPNRGLIILDTSMFSPRYREGDSAGLAQLDWFEAQLNENPDSTFMILMHIPPGVDVFSTLQANAGQTQIGTVVSLFNPVHQARWLDIVQRHAGQISIVLAGHAHRDDFRLPVWSAATGQPQVVTQITSSVSPVYGNNPAIKVLRVASQDLSLLDYRVRYLDLRAGQDQWKDYYTFSEAYRPLFPTRQGMKMLWDFSAPGTPWSVAYADRYVSLGTPEITEQNALYYWYGIRYVDSEEWRQAVNAATSAQQGTGAALWTPLYPPVVEGGRSFASH